MILRPSSRRLLLAGACAAFVPSRALRAEALVATPQQTEGPYYPVEFPADSDNDLVQVRGQAAQAIGTVLHLQGRVLDTDGKPLSGALVEIWQSDSHGIYDHPGQPGREKRDQAFQGYGRVMADAEGRYSFRTLKPVPYAGRPGAHIHLKAAGAGRHLTSQIYIAGEPGNEQDFLWRAATRDPRQRERVEMRLSPANGLERGAVASSLDLVIG
jgi:protocatechuate 3,4-dioxygenase beta subunit